MLFIKRSIISSMLCYMYFHTLCHDRMLFAKVFTLDDCNVKFKGFSALCYFQVLMKIFTCVNVKIRVEICTFSFQETKNGKLWPKFTISYDNVCLWSFKLQFTPYKLVYIVYLKQGRRSFTFSRHSFGLVPVYDWHTYSSIRYMRASSISSVCFPFIVIHGTYLWGGFKFCVFTAFWCIRVIPSGPCTQGLISS